MKRLIVYDLDGTLVDTKADIARAINHMLSELQRPSLETRTICRYVGRGLSQLVQSCLQESDPGRLEQGMRIYRAYYAEHLLDRSTLYPGVRDVLDHFAPRTQAVITNKPDPYSRQILTGLGVIDHFADVITGDSRYPKKPDPAALRALMARYQAEPAGTLLIGDSPIDIETGRQAQVQTVGVAQGFADDGELRAARPAVIVRNFEELLRHARAEGW